MKEGEESKIESIRFQGHFLLGCWEKMEVGRKVILADKNRETNCENTTRHSLYSFIISILYQEILD